MKKILLLITVLFLFVGCINDNSDRQASLNINLKSEANQIYNVLFEKNTWQSQKVFVQGKIIDIAIDSSNFGQITIEDQYNNQYKILTLCTNQSTPKKFTVNMNVNLWGTVVSTTLFQLPHIIATVCEIQY